MRRNHLWAGYFLGFNFSGMVGVALVIGRRPLSWAIYAFGFSLIPCGFLIVPHIIFYVLSITGSARSGHHSKSDRLGDYFFSAVNFKQSDGLKSCPGDPVFQHLPIFK